jgi:hypothetical protein
MGISGILRWFFAAAAALMIPGCGRSSLKEPEIFGGPADAAMDASHAESPYPDMPLTEPQPEGGCTGDGQCGSENCTGGLDDDGDTLADCADPECDYHPACR